MTERPPARPGTGRPALVRRHPVSEVLRMLRYELRDCGTRIDTERAPLEPFILPGPMYDELFTAATGLLALLRRAVLESAPTRAGRLAELGLAPDGDDYPLFTDDDLFEERYCAVMARPDVIIGPHGPQFIEFNVSGAFGGPAETHLLSRVWTDVYGGHEGAPFTGHDPLEARAAFFDQVCEDLGLPRAVAMVGSPYEQDQAATSRYYDIEVDVLRRRGLRAGFFEPDQLPHGLGLPERLDFPVGLRYFATADWTSRGQSLEPVRTVLDAGCLLLPPQSSYLLANKKVLAWLSEGLPWMTETDRALTRRYIPWSRVVGDTKAEWRGRWVDLPELLMSAREQFVLKKAIGMMGREVLIGRLSTPAQWAAEVERALSERDTIVQEYTESVPYELEMCDASGTRAERVAVAPVLSPMVFGGRPGGCYARYFPSGESGVVSVYGQGAMENAVLRGAQK
ncbi:hypothetical protein J7I94_33865 [Streptomyces sp. ISL-12]|uniref:hypothetical protein n=1 Tax=Streptomyces sp. ISL-12 TaxID=2819177 RepID=UPI001BECF814|nr:hypothetical protein [Streptomyces sp. ISL-12]MBT2415465.1 hypothetical protein [Streptomyces sp. ISL-12]